MRRRAEKMPRRRRASPRGSCTSSSCRQSRGGACTPPGRRKRKKRITQRHRDRRGFAERSRVRLFVGEGFDAREFAAAEKFEGGAAAGGNVRDFVGHSGLMNGGNRISAANDGSCALSFCAGDFLLVSFDGLRADVETHPTVRRVVHRNGFRGGSGFEFRADDLVHGKEQGEFLLL